MWADTLLIVFISIFTALLGEGKCETNSSRTVTIYVQINMINQCSPFANSRINLGDGLSHGKVPKAEGRGRKAEQKM